MDGWMVDANIVLSNETLWIANGMLGLGNDDLFSNVIWPPERRLSSSISFPTF